MLCWILRPITMFCTYHNIIFDWWIMSRRGLVFCWIKMWKLVQETCWKWAFIKRTPTVSTLNQFLALVHKAFITETTLSTSVFVPRKAKANHISGNKYLKDIFSIFKKSNQNHYFFLSKMQFTITFPLLSCHLNYLLNTTNFIRTFTFSYSLSYFFVSVSNNLKAVLNTSPLDSNGFGDWQGFTHFSMYQWKVS